MPGGSSWIICDSKSRPGFKYYFNTESGEAVWNLSNKDQIEKAKKHTQILHTKLGTVPELPEPQDQPAVNAQRNLKLPNINQMSNFSNFMNTGARSNDNDWVNHSAVVKQPQIVLVPTIAPMLNPSIANNNLQPTLAFQNALHFTYQNYDDCNVPYDNSNSGNVPYFEANFNNRRPFYRKKQFQSREGQNLTNYRRNGGDLRHKLARKRSLSESNSSHLLVSTQQYCNSNPNVSEDDSTTIKTEKNQKNVTTETFNLEDCYVVVDKDIILNEFVFFDNLVSNDPNFRLVVPHHVMSELKVHAIKNGEARVRRIVRFLTQKIETHSVSLGDEIEDNFYQNGEKTFITCEKLLEKDDVENVVLVSNKIELKKFIGNNDKIKVMSMSKFKVVLSNNKARFSSPTRAIKIIISNDVKIEEANTNDNDSIIDKTDEEIMKNNDESKTTNVVRKVVNVEGNLTNVERKVANVGTSLKSTSPLSKQTVDTAVQTEIETEVNKNIYLDTNAEVNTMIRNKNNIKEREIRLNRTTPMQKAGTEETSNKKQYKWRRNRSLRNQSYNSTTQSTLHGLNETTTNIATQTNVNAATNIISNVTVTESKQKENSSETYTENSSALPKTNSIKGSINNHAEVKTMPYFASENDTKIHKEVYRQTSTESWVDSLPKSKSDIDKDSRSSSQKSKSLILSNKVNSVVHKVPVKPMNKNIVLKNVEMFTVTGHSMEEVLRMRSDEWVSRFVQTMEEILKEKLQENPPFENDEYPPPWNLHEATKCIIKKYSNYFNVVDAANKLSFTLYKVSDEKGKIPLTLEPSEFMDMYSYGVYLIETLQDVSSNNNDDLYAARESLKTLLYDIENAYMDNSCSEIVGDDVHESLVEYTTSTHTTESDFKPGQEQSTPKKKIQNSRATSSKTKKNLRSAKKTSEVPEVTQSKSSSIDKKTAFFSNLKLTTKSISSPSTITSPAYSSITVRSSLKSPVTSPLTVATKLNEKKREKVTSKNKDPYTNDEEIVSSSGQPSFIRNFKICPELEARIKKARSILELNDCDEVYSNDDQCNEVAFDFNMSEYFTSKDGTLKNVPGHIYTNNLNKKELKMVTSFENLKLRCIREIFADVIKHLSVITSDPLKMNEIENFAMKIFPCIENIYNSLDNILKKDGDSKNIKEILKDVIADSAEEEMFFLRCYRNTIIKFRDQAYLIIENLKLILSSSQS